jgi:hypothetical protein
MVIVSLDSPLCVVTLFDPVSVVYRDVTRQAKGLYRLKYVGALWSGLAYLNRYNSGWFCHNSKADALPSAPEQFVLLKKLTDAKEDFIHNKEASTKEEPIAPRADLMVVLQPTTSIRRKSCNAWSAGPC